MDNMQFFANYTEIDILQVVLISCVNLKVNLQCRFTMDSVNTPQDSHKIVFVIMMNVIIAINLTKWNY